MLTKRPATSRLQFSLVACALLLVTMAGCRAAYIARVGYQHLRYVGGAVSIAEEIARTSDEERRRLLGLVLVARSYAEQQGLDVGGSYLKIADTSGLTTAHVVTAAYADRLQPYTWSYPIVGEIPYRGYFERKRAEAFAAKLAARGLDTHIVEASGYSTLGWFDDPLPSGALGFGAVGLVSMIFHELVHQTLYIPGHVAFNETLASAVALRMTVAFFAARGEDALAEEAAEHRRRWLAQGHYCDALASRLSDYFAGHSGAAPALTLAGRAEIYAEARSELAELGLFGDPSDAQSGNQRPPLNNAVFLAVYRYRRGAETIDAYLGRFESLAEALAELAEASDAAEDPYAVL